jgi:hypothetical protein
LALNNTAAGQDLEYLLSYGVGGDFGRFRAVRPIALKRGDRVAARSARGLEAAVVLCPATPRHARYLPNTTLGTLLHRLSPEEERTLHQQRGRSQQLLDRASQLAMELDLPLELLDAEVLLDGEHAVLHLLRWADCDVRPFVSTLSREFAVQLTLEDFTRPHEEEEHGCGSCGSGGCGSGGCGSGGCGSCGSAKPEEVQAYFAGLRTQMEKQRVSLV